MGSLNSDGSPKTQPNINLVIRHQGDFLVKSDVKTDVRLEEISASGVIRTDFDSKGVAWQSGGTETTPGLSLVERNTDNSVEREKFTHNLAPDGNLQQHVTRARGIHVSISDRQAISDPVAANASGLNGGDTSGPMQTISERKVFFLDHARDLTPPGTDWEIFNQSGTAVGPTDGTTDVDSTPNEGLLQ